MISENVNQPYFVLEFFQPASLAQSVKVLTHVVHGLSLVRGAPFYLFFCKFFLKFFSFLTFFLVFIKKLNLLDQFLIRQTLELEKSIRAGGKSILNIVKLSKLVVEYCKMCKKCSPVKFAKFAYFCIMRAKVIQHFEVVVSVFSRVIPKCTKFTNFALFLTHFSVFIRRQ